jgi:hypothetical protein
MALSGGAQALQRLVRLHIRDRQTHAKAPLSWNKECAGGARGFLEVGSAEQRCEGLPLDADPRPLREQRPSTKGMKTVTSSS